MATKRNPFLSDASVKRTPNKPKVAGLKPGEYDLGISASDGPRWIPTFHIYDQPGNTRPTSELARWRIVSKWLWEALVEK
jgi:hypothetical protein